MIHLLPIPHITQRGNLYAADCGPACLLMLVPNAKTYDDAYNAMGLEPGKWAHIYKHLYAGLLHYGIKSDYARLSVQSIREKLATGWPVICLMHYQKLPDDLRRSRYNHAHYVIAVGYDDNNIMIHDPLGEGQAGSYIPYPDKVLERVMRGVPGTSYDRQALVVQLNGMKEETAVVTANTQPKPAVLERLWVASSQIERQTKIIAALIATLETFADYPKPDGRIITGKSQANSETHSAVFYGENPALDKFDLPFSYTLPPRYWLHFGNGDMVRVTDTDWNRLQVGDKWQ